MPCRTIGISTLLFVCSAAEQSQSAFTISTVAGNGVAGFSGDGEPAIDGQLNDPTVLGGTSVTINGRSGYL